MKKLLFILIWLFSLIAISIYVNENPGKIEIIKNYFSKEKMPVLALDDGEIQRQPGNSFLIEFQKVVSLSEKTAFIVHDENIQDFDENSLKIYTQNGYVTNNLKYEKLNLPKVFTTLKNGGVKTIFIYNNNEFALISSSKEGCFYASIVSLNNGKELFKTKCLPKEYIDYNGLGSSNIHHNNKVYLSIGTPEQRSSKIRALAQDNNSMFGKIISIDIKSKDYEIIAMGSRNAQGLYYDEDRDIIIHTEHGPIGGDEININLHPDNKIIENYGWPISSYGTHDDGKFRKEAPLHKSHKDYGFIEPIKYYTPSIAISEIIRIPSTFSERFTNDFFIGALGFKDQINDGDQSIHHIRFNENFDQIIFEDVIPIGERIRDMIFIKEKNIILMILESIPAIGVLKLIN